MNNSRGSEWRKWDLHVHTASSYDYKYNADDSDNLLAESLMANNISVIAITDHFVIDKNRIRNIKTLAKDIVVFPGVELRTDKGDTNIHVILIFQENSDLDILSEDFNVFKRSKAKNGSDNDRIYWDFNDIIDFANDHNAIISIHAGSKTSGIDDKISNLLDHNQAVKAEFAEHVHIFEMGNIKDLEGYKKFVFPSIGKKPMIICSDNHDPRNYLLKINCWIKADQTFAGLKQITYESEDRVRIQDVSPDLDFEKSPFTEIIITEMVQAFNDDNDNVFFAKSTIPLNNNLVSVIGGRGSGKSVLINYLANGLGKTTSKSYTNSENFAIKRRTSIKDTEQKYAFGKKQNIQFMYISQSEIKDIVGNPVNFTKNIRETIGVTDEYNISAEYISDSEAIINEYFRIVKILNSNNTSLEDKLESIGKDIKKYEDFIKNITSEENKIKLEKYTQNIQRLNKITLWNERISNLQLKIIAHSTDINKEIVDINEAWSSVNIPDIDSSKILEYIYKIVQKKIDDVKLDTESEISKTKSEFSSYSGDLTTFLSNVTAYQTKVSKLKEEIEILNKEQEKYNLLKTRSFSKLGIQIETSINKYAEIITNQWTKFKEGHPEMTSDMKNLLIQILENDNLDVIVDVKFNATEFYSLLAYKLDGRTYNVKNLKDILRIDTLDDFYRFVQQDTSAVKLFEETDIKTDLRNKLLDLLYVKYASFITHKIIVRSGGKSITKLSHGQQGTIYLRMKLAANLFTETIIYDQPEDDLDNKFIMTELVELFRKIKKYRQVIIVSHNANLVVNADSEQIIIAENKDGVLNYITGSLEDPVINEKICDILEGGSRAFLEREKKYNLA